MDFAHFGTGACCQPGLLGAGGLARFLARRKPQLFTCRFARLGIQACVLSDALNFAHARILMFAARLLVFLARPDGSAGSFGERRRCAIQVAVAAEVVIRVAIDIAPKIMVAVAMPAPVAAFTARFKAGLRAGLHATL
ncbi:MAG TPA: hypothetical protein VMA30_12580 [Xanthobacteraceae bacterium]|nr:hypothetical protein [Xanthobacteraceae bacterium]